MVYLSGRQTAKKRALYVYLSGTKTEKARHPLRPSVLEKWSRGVTRNVLCFLVHFRAVPKLVH